MIAILLNWSLILRKDVAIVNRLRLCYLQMLAHRARRLNRPTNVCRHSWGLKVIPSSRRLSRAMHSGLAYTRAVRRQSITYMLSRMQLVCFDASSLQQSP